MGRKIAMSGFAYQQKQSKHESARWQRQLTRIDDEHRTGGRCRDPCTRVRENQGNAKRRYRNTRSTHPAGGAYYPMVDARTRGGELVSTASRDERWWGWVAGVTSCRPGDREGHPPHREKGVLPNTPTRRRRSRGGARVDAANAETARACAAERGGHHRGHPSGAESLIDLFRRDTRRAMWDAYHCAPTPDITADFLVVDVGKMRAGPPPSCLM